MEKKHFLSEMSVDGCEKPSRPSGDTVSVSHGHHDQEKRVRREIANSNERRRMQSINAGFDSLRILLPSISDGEKMSKATILQLTAKYINTLLMRVSLLESEVAVYRQSAGLQPSPVVSEISTSTLISRKRKSDDLKDRSECMRNRRRRVEIEGSYDSSRTNYVHFSPESTDTHQSSPLTSFNSSTSICSASPQPESTSSTAARLEHLVMAIEQIEGGGALNVSPQPESHDESFSTGDHSPPETYWHSPQENYHGYTYVDAQPPNQKSNNLFGDSLLLTPVPEINPSLSTADSVHTHNTEDYPIVAKLLNRPIPHKYLHRPQVVVNSSH
ncbi:Transcription factor AP-4 isoform 2 [Schistosoma japonicum]|uniref:Transcription factor AP-4 isoform 2 n=1 Tax=Schistosoma japonicum TaxID=6182 RepID=A0A4Z2CUT9_SCHJA|nr:Transcription factor AP-4 isoform 2 [Schistosoma japonicum]